MVEFKWDVAIMANHDEIDALVEKSCANIVRVPCELLRLVSGDEEESVDYIIDIYGQKWEVLDK